MNFRWQLAQFLEIRWWRRYLAHRDRDQYLAWKKNYWKSFLEKSGIPTPPDSTQILDAGCGPAGIFTIFEKQKVAALDPLLDRYESELAHFRRSDYPNVQFFSERLEDFHLPDAARFDFVFCLNAINHVADLSAAFDNLVRLTAPGGVLAVSVDAHRCGLLQKIFQWFPGDVLHPHQFDLREYSSMLASRGCVVERVVLVKRELIFDYFLLVCRV